ncbi:MAG: hypothetical protein Q8P27_00570 [Candidatus Peregrinibacteria bacterium]|nr:hypothetical protein [Candidatus Peregrinibacteria bacterium]
MKTKSKLLYFGLLMALAFIFYAGFIDTYFFFDDYVWMDDAQQSMQDITHITTLNISHFFRPVVHFAMLIQYAIFGLNPAGFHVVAILLHGLNAVLFYYFLKDALKIENEKILTWAPVIWVSQYIYVEAVVWISSLTNILLTTWILLAFIGLGRKKLWLFLLGFTLVFLTKEEGAFIFPLILLYLYLFKDKRLSKILPSKEVLLSGLIWGIYMVIQFILQKSAPLVTEQIFSFDEMAIVRWFEKIIALFLNLQPAINMIPTTLVLVVMLFLAFYGTENKLTKAQSLFMIAFLMLALVPTSFLNFDNSATRYFYNASLGSSLIITVLWLRIWDIPKVGKWIAVPVILLYMGANYLNLQTAEIIFEELGSHGENLIAQIEPEIENLRDQTFNFVEAPYAESAMDSLMKVYFEIPKEQIVYDQPLDAGYVNITWGE